MRTKKKKLRSKGSVVDMRPRSRISLFMRERSIRIEVSRETFEIFKSRGALIALLLVCTLGIVFGYAHRGVAETNLYPQTCLGDWDNTQLASGKPDLDGTDESLYSSANSASITDALGQIYCGDFIGDYSPDTTPTNIIVRFSWVIKPDATTTPTVENNAFASTTAEILALPDKSSLQVLSGTTSPDASSSVTIIAPSDASTSAPEQPAAPSTPTQNTTDTTTPAQTPATPENPGTTPEPAVPPTQSTDTTSNNTSAPAPTDAAPAPTQNNPTPTQDSQSPAPVPVQNTAPAPADSGPQSLVRLFTEVAQALLPKTAYAQTATTDTTTPAIPIDTPSSSSPATTSIQESAATSTGTSTPDLPSTEDIAEVLYSLDGTTWQTLGMVERSQLQSAQFDVPLSASSTWSDISKIQIRIRTLSTPDPLGTVYLDGITLSVAYTKNTANPDDTATTTMKLLNNGAGEIDATSTTRGDYVHIRDARPGATFAIYWLDDPDTRTSNVYSATIADDGTLSVDTGTLPAGKIAFVATTDPGGCGEFTYDQCTAAASYLGQVQLDVIAPVVQ